MKRVGPICGLTCWLMLSAVLPAQQYVFRAFRQAEGLNSIAATSLATDRSGFLWIGTENGVYRFLGTTFERYGTDQGIAELEIRDVVSDPNGTIWVATEGNLYRWDGQRFFPAGQVPIPIEGLQRIVVEDARHLLIIQKEHVYRLEHDADGKMLSYLPVFPDSLLASMPDLAHLTSVNVVSEPGDGQRYWAGCGNGLCSWLGRDISKGVQPHTGIVTEWGKDKGLAADHWEDVLLDRTGTLWAGGIGHVAVLLPGSARFVERNISGSDPQSRYGHAPLIEDPEGRVLAPAKDGIARWDGTAWRIIGRANGMGRATRIVAMVFDESGDLWFASNGDGLFEWTGYGDWEGWSDQQNLPSAGIWALIPASATRVFVGTDRGPGWVDPHDGSAGSLSAHRRWVFGQMGGMVVDRDGSLLAGTASGAILRIDPRTGRTEQTGKLPTRIVSILKDPSGNLYFETFDGLYLRDAGGSGLQRVKAVDALLGDSKRVQEGCRSPDGGLWFLGRDDRLMRFKDGAWTAPPIDGLPTTLRGELLSLSCAQNGAIWVTGDLTGTWRLTPSGQRLSAWKLELPPEMRTLTPLAIVADHRGWVWMGTDMGLLVWNGQSWRHLTQESGLIWNDVNQGIMREASDGSMWIGTSGGLSHLLHPEHVFDSIPLLASLTEIKRGDTNYLGLGQIKMTWAGPPLQFRVSSPTLRNLSELVLKIRMVGFQSDWMVTRGNATFSRLPPGEFTFMAKVCNPDLNACSEPVQVGITVLPPWWRTYWCYGLCILAFLLLLALSVHLYARQLRARGRHLELLVSQRTRELEASREQLHIQATHDGLTGMLNRVAILRTLTAELERARREKRTVVVALIDLDYFKRINDEYGHLAGDEALRWFAAAVGAAIRLYDHAGRYGGEEFLLVLTEVPREAVEQRLTRLHKAISNLQINQRGVEFRLNCSMGATVFDPSDGPGSVESLLSIADQALYAAKAAGRNRVIFRAPGASDALPQEQAQSTNLS